MEIREVTQQNTLMVRLITSLSRISEVMKEVYTEIGTFMQHRGIEYTGAPYAMYYNMDMEALDLEIGFPVTAPVETEGRISNGTIPGGKIATTVHKGPYDTLEKTYMELLAFVRDKGVEVEEQWMYEYYLNDPAEVKPEELLTQICYIVKKES
ncbi:MAG: GyrI-like domain-containing protein [Sphaerochaetaceae bacterium]|nr:GyrI-like domain-containing protein [Sphaerochaetaceae bacterium]